MITHVGFDFDGTLVDSRAAALHAFNALADEHGFGRLTDENLPGLRQMSMIQRCRALGLSPLKVPALMIAALEHYREALETVRFFHGIPELLQTLAERRIGVTIVSSNAVPTIEAVLARSGTANLVSEVHSSPRLFGKARVLQSVMKRRGLSAAHFVYVGDEHRDMEAARDAKVRSIGVGWGFDAKERILEGRPDAFAESPAELLAQLERWAR